MRTRRNGATHTSICVLLVALMLLAGLASGCAADEPSGNGTSGTDTGSETPSDSGTTGDSTGDAAGTRPEGELPEGATHFVADVLDTPSNGLAVVLSGEVASMVDGENFMLADSTGEILIDGDNDFGTIAVGDLLLVTGTVKMEDSPSRVEIQATAIERR